MRNDSGSWLFVTGMQFTVLSFRGSFWHVLRKCFETSLRWSFNILPFPCQVYGIPTQKLVQTFQRTIAQLYQPCGSLQDVSKQHWGKTFHTFQFLSLYLLYKANILCIPQTFAWKVRVDWHHHISIFQNPRLGKQLSVITGTRVNLFLLLKKEIIQLKGLTDIKIIFV